LKQGEKNINNVQTYLYFFVRKKMEEKKSGKNAQSLCWLYFIMEKEIGKNIATRRAWH
jgi:hypothetical protein